MEIDKVNNSGQLTTTESRNNGLKLFQEAKSDSARLFGLSRAEALANIARFEYKAGLDTTSTVEDIKGIFNDPSVQKNLGEHEFRRLRILSTCLADVGRIEEAKSVAIKIVDQYEQFYAIGDIVLAIARSKGVSEARQNLSLIDNALARQDIGDELATMERLAALAIPRVISEEEMEHDRQQAEFYRNLDIKHDRERAERLHPEDFRHFIDRANDAIEKGQDPSEHLSWAQRALEKDPKYIQKDGHFLLDGVYLYASVGLFKQAIDLATTIPNWDIADRLKAERNIARLQLRRKLYSDADSTLERITEVLDEFRKNPSVGGFADSFAEFNEEVYEEYAIAKVKEGAFDEAEIWIGKVKRGDMVLKALVVAKAEAGYRQITSQNGKTT